jgi:hypothetical protein
MLRPCVARVQFAPPMLSDTSNRTRRPSPDWWFRRKTDMDKTRFFSEQMTSGSRREASDEDMQRGITDFGAEEMPNDSTFFMSEEGGGFVGRATASSLLAAREAEAAGGG